MNIDWEGYDPGPFYDELISAPGKARGPAGKLVSYLQSQTLEKLKRRQQAAEAAIKTLGITFTVYSDGENIDREWPFDILPRVISEKEWQKTEQGLEQRLRALNCFIDDVYNEQKIFKDKVIPRDLLNNSANFRPQCVGMKPLFGVWAHVCGTDLVRDNDGQFYVLEDNLRVPSGVSYMLENRSITKRAFPELFNDHRIRPVSEYPSRLFDMLASLSPRPLDYPEVVVLTPGIYNSAYFEHSYLAQRMGAELVEGNDLVVGDDDCVYMRTINGLSRVDVIYRRIDDMFLDPQAFNPDSVLGVPGLMRSWLKGKVALANAPGAGVADDKVVYTYVPKMIEYYLGEQPIIPNVPSYLCMDDQQRQYVLDNLDKLVVKPANESGGYGMLIGPQATRKELAAFAERIKADPRNYIAQPLLALSTSPILTKTGVEPRHLDLRPFILQARDTYVTAGGLTRVALVKGSYVVNSSQGGGSKDTWIVKDQ
ncbi:circularly permuted type 2 ATP-grasp protein [Aestuariirhabdus litorea]|uniref:Circularly permuted type 2 ATP-grasp protein n=1 Tax=Aestuariirhabdus litorea TaxID=2528527 RepID=A0A3P3VR46_9GAMM|nr:circularly permuted type 2 ATP-grasp protein [Aestuariirhabdus litorea]RRJ83999.1 circularly permuted type 2 ATP-grasp protein [Aestuariirhabdus litorea]RWW97219.1 circularly permuted type 2 ATP-grasp protein [Endozoicomonadaceae bacterium GTF-13]